MTIPKHSNESLTNRLR